MSGWERQHATVVTSGTSQSHPLQRGWKDECLPAGSPLVNDSPRRIMVGFN